MEASQEVTGQKVAAAQAEREEIKRNHALEIEAGKNRRAGKAAEARLPQEPAGIFDVGEARHMGVVAAAAQRLAKNSARPSMTGDVLIWLVVSLF